jgi:hypothetical protein
VSGVFQNIDPPLHPASVSSPRTTGGGVHTRRSVRGWGVNILEDARHRIGLLQYNLSMYLVLWNLMTELTLLAVLAVLGALAMLVAALLALVRVAVLAALVTVAVLAALVAVAVTMALALPSMWYLLSSSRWSCRPAFWSCRTHVFNQH